MVATCLLILSIAAMAGDGLDPAELVRRLGSDHFAERVEATRALEALGPKAESALRAGRDSADPRVQARATAILAGLAERGAKAAALGPALIKLDYRDRPLGEVIQDLNARHNLKLAVQFGPIPTQHRWIDNRSDEQKAKQDELLARPVTLEAAEPVPFWDAIDRLCRVSDLRHDLQPLASFSPAGGRFLLYSGMSGRTIAADSGPFRVLIGRMHATWQRDFTGEPAGGPDPYRGNEARPTDRELDVRLWIVAQPGRLIYQNGPVRIDEAIDDQGRDLIPLVQRGPMFDQSFGNHTSSGLEMAGPSGFNLIAPLRLPDPPGRTIRRLRGAIPVVGVGYAPEPLAIRLSGAAGKSARTEDVTLTIRKVGLDPQRGVTIEVGLASNHPDPRSRRTGQPQRPDFATYHPSQIGGRLKLVDADGHELATSLQIQQDRGFNRDGPVTVLMTPLPITANAPVNSTNRSPSPTDPARRPLPFELRFYSFAPVETEVPFDFRDVPLP